MGVVRNSCLDNSPVEGHRSSVDVGQELEPYDIVLVCAEKGFKKPDG